MSSALRQDDFYISPEQYLAAEQLSEEKHEHVAGKIYAMAGANAAHERIAGTSPEN
jgi:hypothetical protein